MRLEIEIDYEPEPDEQAQIQQVRETEMTDLARDHHLRQITQSIFGFTGATVQGVQVFDD